MLRPRKGEKKRKRLEPSSKVMFSWNGLGVNA
jgi:hypothetical protein